MSRASRIALALAMMTTVSASTGAALAAETVELRFATFNASLFGDRPQALAERLKTRNDEQLSLVAATIQAARPDVVLINEFDYDPSGKAAEDFLFNYLMRAQHGQSAIRYRYHYTAPVNTGLDSGLDLNRDGEVGGANDAWGFGRFPGQYGMLVLSRYPIDPAKIRSLRKFKWRDMPGALLPTLPDGESWYSERILRTFPLSSKAHWDIPIWTRAGAIHFLVSHPTPPVFDGDEDRNGRRNHDEIRLWADYVSIDPARHDYIYDDDGRTGGLAVGEYFVIAGDLNADPHDGDSYPGAIDQLLSHPRIQATPTPASTGAAESAHRLGGGNLGQTGDPSHDTAVFGGHTGNLRVDYVLPSQGLRVLDSGVFWPLSTEANAALLDASDHRLVWVDIQADALPPPAPVRKRGAR